MALKAFAVIKTISMSGGGGGVGCVSMHTTELNL